MSDPRVPIAVVVVILLSARPAMGATPPASLPREALEVVRQIAIQHNGRLKPFDSFARETLWLITGAPRLGQSDPVETVCAIMANPESWQDAPLVSVPFLPLRDALGMDHRVTHSSYNALVATRKLMRMLPPIVQKQQREEKLSILEEETMDAFQRFVTLSNLFEQKLELIPPASATERVWVQILAPTGYSERQQEAIRTAWTDLMRAIRDGPGEALIASAHRAVALLQGLRPAAYPARWRLRLEVGYNHRAPLRAAQALYIVAAIVLLLGVAASRSRLAPLGLAAFWAAFLLHGAGIAIRVILGGRPPVSNFFETTLWLPFVAAGLALILERVYRARAIVLAAAMLAPITLILADHLPLDSSISPVVAVLHSNLWLTIHVLTIVASYGALALAMVLAHFYAVAFLRGRRRTLLASLDLLLYRAIQVGVVLLTSGIMLGAVWANASWGRYWGWDPKETWALITLLWFLALLHGRFAGWLKGIGVALSAIGGFFLLLMTYYGVSFYLVGLHSYAGGHAKPIPPLLLAYLFAEGAFMSLVGLATLRRRNA